MKPTTENMPEISLRTLVSEPAKKVAPISAAVPTQVTYHELDEVPVRKVDVLEQLERNLQTLSDQHSRLQFLMREVRYLMKM